MSHLEHDWELHGRLLALVAELEPHLERSQLLLKERARLCTQIETKSEPGWCHTMPTAP